MSVIIDHNKCTGCKKCVEVCPGDLLAIDKKTNKAFIYHPEDCWDCMACIKICPQDALETKLPYQLANYKASLKPIVKQDRIIWCLTDLKENKEEFVIKTLEV